MVATPTASHRKLTKTVVAMTFLPTSARPLPMRLRCNRGAKGTLSWELRHAAVNVFYVETYATATARVRSAEAAGGGKEIVLKGQSPSLFELLGSSPCVLAPAGVFERKSRGLHELCIAQSRRRPAGTIIASLFHDRSPPRAPGRRSYQFVGSRRHVGA